MSKSKSIVVKGTNFNYGESAIIKNEAGFNRFSLTDYNDLDHFAQVSDMVGTII